ncbi:MAG: flagellar hook-basal body complex protein FliE [Thermoleophilia bacterium]
MIAPIAGIGDVGGTSASMAAQIAAASAMPAPMAPLQVAPVGADASSTPATGGFGTLLTRAISGLNDQVNTADRMQQLAATGQLSDPQMAIVETTKAELALSTALQVRNKLVEGWQELSRMSV